MKTLVTVVSRAFSFMRGNILVMTICESLWRISVDIVWPFLSIYILELGGRYETIGLVMAVGNLASMILYPLGGYIADYQGRIKLIGYMTFGYASTFLIFALSDSWQWLAVGMFAQSFISFYFPAMQALRADSLPPEHRGLGFATTMAIPSAIGIASPMIGGWLIETFGLSRAMRGLYFLGFFVGLAVAIVRLKFLRETVAQPDRIDITLKSVPRLLISSYSSVVETVKEASRQLLTLSILISSCVFFVAIASPFWIVRAYETIGITTQQWGVLLFVTGVINVVLSIPAGSLADRVSKKLVISVSLIAGSVATLLYLRCTTFIHVLILSVAITLTNTFLNPAFQTLFADITPREKRGRIMASIGASGVRLMGGAWGNGILGMLMLTAGSFLSGYIYNYDSSLPWCILSALFMLGIMFIVFVKDPKIVEV